MGFEESLVVGLVVEDQKVEDLSSKLEIFTVHILDPMLTEEDASLHAGCMQGV